MTKTYLKKYPPWTFQYAFQDLYVRKKMGDKIKHFIDINSKGV